MIRVHAILRRLVPSVPVLSRNRLLMAPLDAIDRAISLPFGESGKLPPNRLRIRVGAGDRILFNQFRFRLLPVNFWLNAFATGLVRLDSRVLDVGCGCGRIAATLRDFDFGGTRFTGLYTGIDVDREMIEWCSAHFPAQHFTFKHIDVGSTVYNPRGSMTQARFDLEDESQGLVFALSLLTHLLEPQLRGCLPLARRVLAPGKTLLATVFCLDDMEGRLGGRWTFRHRCGPAHVESPRYPEAAVAYSRSFLESACDEAGFTRIEIRGGGGQSLLCARRRS